MRYRRASYWVRLYYNGVVIGIWPSAALAFLLTTTQRTLSIFTAIFVISMAILVPIIMWMIHKLVVPWRPLRRRNEKR